VSAGRCSGCGFEDVSCRKVKTHVLTCSVYLALYRSDPDRCLSPEVAYVKFRSGDPDAVASAAEFSDRKLRGRIARLEERFVDADRARERQVARFSKSDFLADD
jgi:hypothetical protein